MMFIRITAEKIALDDALRHLEARGAGAIVTFSGVIRPTDAEGRPLAHVEYEAYTAMAELCLKKIGEELREQWPITDLVILHRVSRVAIGEPSVVIAVAAPHRAEAFRACEQAIDRLKTLVPIWKKEVLARAPQAAPAGSPQR